MDILIVTRRYTLVPLWLSLLNIKICLKTVSFKRTGESVRIDLNTFSKKYNIFKLFLSSN